VVRIALKRFGSDAAAALEALGTLPRIGQKMFQCSEEIGAETAAPGCGAIEAVAGKNAGEELLGEFTRVVVIAAFAPKEAQDGLVIRLAQFG
jgi:hypothetical protein